ncbi:MAG: hypothetical protein AB1813_20150 [Verrucomicrobiota bacterium]|jgi:hypothetical protein
MNQPKPSPHLHLPSNPHPESNAEASAISNTVASATSTTPLAELNDDAGLALPDAYDPVIEHYKKDVDRTLLRQNLKLTPQQRSEKFEDFARFAYGLWKAGEQARKKNPDWGLK